MATTLRADRQGPHRSAFDKNKKIILKTQDICGICGKPVNKHLKAPDPMSPVIDHIIPVSKGGHPSSMDNLQLAHWSCNRQKSDKLFNVVKETPKVIGNRNLPQSIDWTLYKPSQEFWTDYTYFVLKEHTGDVRGAYPPPRASARHSRRHCTNFLTP